MLKILVTLLALVLPSQMSPAANGRYSVYVVKVLTVSMQQAVLTFASYRRSPLYIPAFALQSAVTCGSTILINVQGI